MSVWTAVCRLEDIPRLGARVVETPLGRVAVFRTREDEVFALEDRCPHRGGPLSQGIVHGRRVTCPLHEWVIELETGTAVPPDEGCVLMIPARMDDGQVALDLGSAECRRTAAE
jgi:nitrite reductase (NADH) small subunit